MCLNVCRVLFAGIFDSNANNFLLFVLFQDLLAELNIKPENKPDVLGLAVAIAMERHDPYRELTSRLISDLYGNFLTLDEMQKGFDDLLENLADLTLDTPDAPTVSVCSF